MNSRFSLWSWGLILWGVIAALSLWIWAPREPRYQGKPLSQCLMEVDGLTQGTPPPLENLELLEEYRRFVRVQGTNSIPILRRMLGDDGVIRDRFVKVVNGQTWINYRLISQQARKISALQACAWLRENARLLTPDVMGCLSDPDPSVRFVALSVLPRVNPNPGQVVPSLIQLIQKADEPMRFNAIRCLLRHYGDALPWYSQELEGVRSRLAETNRSHRLMAILLNRIARNPQHSSQSVSEDAR